MRDQIVVKRYAKAYIDFAQPKIGVDQCVKEMVSLKKLLREERDLEDFLKAPGIQRSEKVRILNLVLKDNFSEETITFIDYLILKRRILNLVDIANEVRLKFAHGELIDIVLRTTFPLELDLVLRIKEKLEAKLNKKTNLYLELDPDLLGGVQIVIGNTVIDGSVRNRLFQLKKKLLQSQVI